MVINRAEFEKYIKNFQFGELFNKLGWDNVVKTQAIAVKDVVFELEAVARKHEFLVLVCSTSDDQKFPDISARNKIDREINKLYLEHLLIFVDSDKTRQIWQLSVKEPNKPVVIHETDYYVSQTPELLYQKLSGLLFTFDEEDKIGLVDVLKRVSDSFEVNAKKVTKSFYIGFQQEHAKFRDFIEGIDESIDRDWYTSLMLNRLMFIYFIQKKGFLNNDQKYLRNKLTFTQEQKGKNKFYSFYKDFLLILFHQGLGSPERDDALLSEIGKVPYLNGGLFDVHQIEENYDNISIPDEAFEYIFAFFDEYNWHLDTRETASGKDINPDVMGYIFEKYINDRASMGAYYTKEDITEYISKNCIIPFLFEKTRKDCKNAFHPDSGLWKLLEENPDRYIYDAVKHGIWEVLPGDHEHPEGIERKLPSEIEEGLDTSQPNLLERRKTWNRSAPSAYALPTEIWREVVERRKRYFDIRSKIKNVEITNINDFITFNLNIRQFAQDAIEQYEGSDFVNAFHKAIIGITILDPACGSGAFLFASLNVLEPLYLASITRMRDFVEEDDEQDGRKFSPFRKVLAEINNHPNERYYIYKSIILNNLYGVDIMKEAVEIAKLRLFLKLIAEVDQIDKIEPMPDIDYNIRSGNTLVGFATYHELRLAIEGGPKKGDRLLLDLDNVAERFREHAEVVSMAYRRFKKIQLEDDLKQDASTHLSFKESKIELEERLQELNEKLDYHLAKTYGQENQNKFDAWKKSHQPFHWFAEFYEILHEKGGFDVVIGNPPYVEYSNVRKNYTVHGFESLNSGNIYALFIERSLSLQRIKARNGMIIQLSAFCTPRMESFQKVWFSKAHYSNLCFFDDRPGKLFDGLQHIRVVICLIEKGIPNEEIATTNYVKFYSEFRPHLYQTTILGNQLAF